LVLGLEPAAEFHPTEVAASTSVICAECGAARALHFGPSNWLDLASLCDSMRRDFWNAVMRAPQMGAGLLAMF
jgi:hypothetical protein